MPKRIPFIDETYWEKVNPYLSQLLTPENGGINLWTNATRPSGLLAEDIGRTGWNLDAGCLQRWNGTSWVNLQPSLTTLGTEIHKIFEEWNPIPPPQWLIDLILNTINEWEPLKYPSWLNSLLQDLIDNLELSDIENLLNIWNPPEGSEVKRLLDLAMETGGLTELQVKDIITNWDKNIPPWLVQEITNKLAEITFDTLTGRATLKQIQKALDEWYEDTLKAYIDNISLEDLGGNITFEQIRNALNKWFTEYLKKYIDDEDKANKKHADDLRTPLLQKVNDNYTELLNLINNHSHTTPTTTIPLSTTPVSTTTTTTTTPPPTTTTAPPSAIYWGSNTTLNNTTDVAFVSTGVQSSGALSFYTFVNDATMNATIDITLIRIPGKINGVNNIPSSISYASLTSATGAQTSNHSLEWNLGNPIGPFPAISVATTTQSSDNGYNIYMKVNSATRNGTPLKSIVVGFNASGGSSPSMTITYTGPSTDTV